MAAVNNNNSKAKYDSLVSVDYSDFKVKSIDRNIEATPENATIEKLIFKEVLPSRSFASRAIFSYDVPEVKDFESKFVYNYFTPDERVRSFLTPEDQLINIDSSNTSEIFYQVKNDKLPRYVKFSFKPANDPYAKKATNSAVIIRDNLDKLIIEGAGSTAYHTGFELLDTNLEKNIYSMLAGSLTYIDEIDTKNSPTSAAKKLEEALGETGGLTGQSKKLIIESLNNLQSEGYSSAPSDVDPEIAATSNDPLAKQTFSIKLNNSFAADLIERSARIPDKVFQDELRALIEPMNSIQNSVTIDPFVTSDAEYENTVSAISIVPFDNLAHKNLINTNHEIKQIGYMIQRFEVLPDESIRALEPIFSDNPDSLYVIDKNVRYGGVYVYKIRTVCTVKTIIRDEDLVNGDLDQLSVAEFLLASEGRTTSTSCFESEPPPPPTRFRVRLEGRTKKPLLTWQFPVNPQRDIKRFQIFKRKTVQSPFTLIGEYDFDDSFVRTEPIETGMPERVYRMDYPRLDFIDHEYNLGEEPIYALSSVDAHGYSSALSAQIKASYNRFKNKIEVSVISGEGAPKPYPNLLLEQDAFKDAIKTSGHDRMTVFFDPEYYRVFKTKKRKRFNRPSETEFDQNFLVVNPEKPTYQINIINLDLQKDKTIKIKIADKSGRPIVSPVSGISKNNINFEFGVQ